MATLINPDGTFADMVGTGAGAALTLEQLQRAVGGFIEHVRCNPDRCGQYDHAFCCEHGKLDGLPVNRLASYLCRPHIAPGDSIHGPVVFCSSGRDGESY